jgi:hypothetical protein
MTDRRKEIQEALLSANVGCLLLFALVFGLPLIGVGGLFAMKGLNSMREQARLNEVAVAVPGTIISSAVRGTMTGSSARGEKTSYWPEMEFSYEYAGETRTSKRVWPVTESGRESKALRVVERYSTGMEVSALVDPADPSMAFLERRWSQAPYLSILIGCLPTAFVTGLGVLLAGWKRPSEALIITLLVGTVVIGIVLMTGSHYLRVMPATERVWWMWLVLVLSVPLAGSPLAVMPKVRSLHRCYRQGQGQVFGTE